MLEMLIVCVLMEIIYEKPLDIGSAFLTQIKIVCSWSGIDFFFYSVNKYEKVIVDNTI